MKRWLGITAAAVYVACAVCCQAGATSTRLEAAVFKMEKLVYPPVRSWQAAAGLSQGEALDPRTSGKKFHKVGIGYVWPITGGGTRWLRTKFRVPEKVLNTPVAGATIALRLNIDDYGEIYVDGEFRNKFFREGGYAVLTEEAKPGEEIFIAVKAIGVAHNGMLADASIEYSMFDEVAKRIYGLREIVLLMDVLMYLKGEDSEKWKGILNDAGDALDLESLEDGRTGDFFASLDRCERILSPVAAIMKKYSMMLVGYSHIDPAWLWDKAEGEHIVWKGTSEGILKLIDEFPDFVYAANQMHCYRWMEKDYPELFERIRKAVASGRWEPVGAEWVEPDGNLPSGESFVRQFLYGRKYSLEKFGKVSTIGWTPDSFGYNWNMPQILTKSDMLGFVSVKLRSNDTTQFPYNFFWWEAPDGSRVFVIFPPGHYNEPVFGDRMAQQLIEVKQKHGTDNNPVIFGAGDHGGGIPRDYFERAFMLRDSPVYPRIEFMSAEQMFDRMLEEDKTLHFPTWKDELYLEKHRGTYTSQAKTKNNNRRNEHRLMNAERFSSIASLATGVEYPFEKIEEAWKILLFNQFHDILPGSSITQVYKDADADHEWIGRQCAEATGPALEGIAGLADTMGGGTPLVLFNGLSWPRDDVVEAELSGGADSASVQDDAGRDIPVQVITKADGKRAALFAARNIPAMGFAVYRLAEGKESGAAGGPLSVNAGMMENEYFTVRVDPVSGWVTSIMDRKNGREVVESGGEAFKLQALRELDSSDAWDAVYPSDGGLMEMLGAEEVTVVERGPVRVTVMARRRFGNESEFRQYYSLVEGVPVVFCRLDVDWREKHVTLKSVFHLNLDADYATFEIPYATIKHPTRPQTPEEKAKWEVSGHRWADYTDRDNEYGASLLSFSKYGYDVRDNVLRMTLLRGPVRPDPLADRGSHSIPYALYPHKGGWEGADTPLRGAEYNDPLIVISTTSHEGKLGKRHSFFSAGPDNVVISTIKKAENGEGFILRLVETSGLDGSAVVDLPGKPQKVVETNLVERDLNELLPATGPALTVPIGHYEIKSLRVVF
jgi:alpha-mannosidase